MSITIPKKGLRIQRGAMAALVLGVFAGAASAGQLSFAAGSWSSLTGTAATTTSLVETKTFEPAGGSLAVRAMASGTQTLRGTLSFSVTWRPTTSGETPLAKVKVTFKRSATPIVEGTGVAKVEAISAVPPTTTELLKVDSSLLILSEITKYLPDVVVTAPLVLQPDGTYKASGTVVSDQLTATFDSLTSTTTKVTEEFALAGLEETN